MIADLLGAFRAKEYTTDLLGALSTQERLDLLGAFRAKEYTTDLLETRSLQSCQVPNAMIHYILLDAYRLARRVPSAERVVGKVPSY